MGENIAERQKIMHGELARISQTVQGLLSRAELGVSDNHFDRMLENTTMIEISIQRIERTTSQILERLRKIEKDIIANAPATDEYEDD